MLLFSRFVVPVNAPVIENGFVHIEQGCIVSLGHAADRPIDNDLIDYGDAVICPGFVNAHTHLELSSLCGKVAPTDDFTDWLKRLVRIIRAELSTKEQLQASVRLGIEQSLACGVTCVGDITREPDWIRPILAQSPLCGVSFGEIIAIGKMRDQWRNKLLAATKPYPGSSRMRVGVSPHAPYTVDPEVMAACAEKTATLRIPLCMHIAETLAEAEFTLQHRGPFRQHLAELGVWDDNMESPSSQPIDLALTTGLLTSRTVVAHANYVCDDDINKLAQSQSSVAYCPRTHEAFGHQPHRYRAMLRAGVNVAIGADSLASNPTLSVLEELQCLRHRDGVDPQLLMEMGTINGAKALGRIDQVGSLTPGKSADLAVMALPNSHVREWAGIFNEGIAPMAVYAAGEVANVHQ